jgi:glycosyltransferase involved in cell wall biosynthesis
MDSLPKISIVIPTYNSQLTLEETLLSISRQNYNNTEVIIVDGGSIDSTRSILKDHEDKISIVISEPDLGVYDAMNKGANIATGDWLYFLGSDDILLDGVLHRVAKCLLSSKCVYYGDVIFKYANLKYAGRIETLRLLNMNFPHQAIFYPRSVFQKFSYNLKYKILADYALNIKLKKSYNFHYIGLTVAIFNDRYGLSPNNVDREFEDDRLAIYRKEFGYTYACIFIIRKSLSNLKKFLVDLIGLKK